MTLGVTYLTPLNLEADKHLKKREQPRHSWMTTSKVSNNSVADGNAFVCQLVPKWVVLQTQT